MRYFSPVVVFAGVKKKLIFGGYAVNMQSRWHHLKEEAVAKRRNGVSMTVIERELGIPRSTLSGWFRNVGLSQEQRSRLWQNSLDGWKKGRARSVLWHNQQKAKRLAVAKEAADSVLEQIDYGNPVILDLALAMLYLGEGAKNGSTSLGSSDPMILKFFLSVLYTNYDLKVSAIRCYLHLRADQDEEHLKQYWAQTLKIPLNQFGKVSFDQRTTGRKTYPSYKGVCVIYCGSVAIQRKLIYLYNGFCQKASEDFFRARSSAG